MLPEFAKLGKSWWKGCIYIEYQCFLSLKTCFLAVFRVFHSKPETRNSYSSTWNLELQSKSPRFSSPSPRNLEHGTWNSNEKSHPGSFHWLVPFDALPSFATGSFAPFDMLRAGRTTRSRRWRDSWHTAIVLWPATSKQKGLPHIDTAFLCVEWCPSTRSPHCSRFACSGLPPSESLISPFLFNPEPVEGWCEKGDFLHCVQDRLTTDLRSSSRPPSSQWPAMSKPVGISWRVEWCEKGDSNPQTVRYRILNPARLPVPPFSHGEYYTTARK